MEFQKQIWAIDDIREELKESHPNETELHDILARAIRKMEAIVVERQVKSKELKKILK